MFNRFSTNTHFLLRSLAFLCAFLAFSIVQCAHANDDNGPENVTIFIYHKFGESKYPTTNVSKERFAEQVQYLDEQGYKVLPLAYVVNLLQKGEKLPSKSAVITIDDGYLSTYTTAWPILKKHGFPFTVFIYVKAIESGYRNFLSWDQVREMEQSGVDFQDHTYSHHRLGSRPQNLAKEDYSAWVKSDLLKSRELIEKRLGYLPKYLALPYGEYNPLIINVAKEIGYEAVFSQDPGSVSSHIDRYAVPREPILGNDWSSMKHFKKVLNRIDLPIRDPNPVFIQQKVFKPDNFCASIIDLNRFQKDSLGIYVSELGWQKPSLVDNRLCIDNTVPIKRRTNRVAISGREKTTNRAAIHYWLLINSDLHE